MRDFFRNVKFDVRGICGRGERGGEQSREYGWRHSFHVNLPSGEMLIFPCRHCMKTEVKFHYMSHRGKKRSFIPRSRRRRLSLEGHLQSAVSAIRIAAEVVSIKLPFVFSIIRPFPSSTGMKRRKPIRPLESPSSELP
jgi:hypothetical protein